MSEPERYEAWVKRVADALHQDCLLEWQAIGVADPGRLITQHMADAHYGKAHDLVRRLNLAAFIEGSDPASPEARTEQVAKIVANLRQQVAIGADTQTREAVVHMLDKIVALVGNESGIEGSDPASPDPTVTVPHYGGVQQGSDPASPEAALDVARLARAMLAADLDDIPEPDDILDSMPEARQMATRIAAEYARLAESPVTGEGSDPASPEPQDAPYQDALDAFHRLEARDELRRGQWSDPGRVPNVAELEDVLRAVLPHNLVYAIRPTGDPFVGWARMMLGVAVESSRG